MTWSALTTPNERYRKDGEVLRFPIVDTESIYKGDMVRVNADGEATSTAAPAEGDMFVGIAQSTVDNTDDGEYITVDAYGVFPLTKDTPAQADVGTLAYVDPTGNQQTVVIAAGTGAGSGILVGAVVGLEGTTQVLVKLQPMLAIGAAAG